MLEIKTLAGFINYKVDHVLIDYKLINIFLLDILISMCIFILQSNVLLKKSMKCFFWQVNILHL